MSKTTARATAKGRAVLKTRPGALGGVEIAQVGYLGPNARGGVVVEQAAQVMSELQNDQGEPLAGAALEQAARKFADLQDLEIVHLSEEEIAGLAQELGAAPDRPPANEVALEGYRNDHPAPPEEADQPAAEQPAGDETTSEEAK